MPEHKLNNVDNIAWVLRNDDNAWMDMLYMGVYTVRKGRQEAAPEGAKHRQKASV